MTYPALTAFYGALLCLIYLALGAWVIVGRVRSDTLNGDDDGGALTKRIRSHGNFVEYVPFTLGLIALLEAGGASSTLVRSLLVILVVARIAHPIGMFASKNPRQFACRGGGTIATYGVALVAAIALLVR